MIDTHAHLDFPDFDEDREEVISRAFSNRVEAIINVGVDLERSRKSIAIAEKYEKIFVSAGIHPHYFSDKWKNWKSEGKIFNELKDLAKHKKVVAIGETGLDYFSFKEDKDIGKIKKIKEWQKVGFLAQIEIAHDLNLPVIVHCRDAWGDLYDIVSQKLKVKSQNGKIYKNKEIENIKCNLYNIKLLLHCYSGDLNDTEKFLKLPNIYFSFSGNITYPKPTKRAKQLAEVVRMIPLDKIMLDSDSPFLAPQNFRGKRNEPIYIRYINEKIAMIKELSEKEVEIITDKNAKDFFGI